MLEQEPLEIDSFGLQRLKTVQFFAKELVKNTADKTIYEAYNGVLGNLMLKPSWAISDPKQNDVDMIVNRQE